MISESDVSQYRKRPVRVKKTNGRTFEGIYIGWQLDVSDEVPNAMLFKPLDGRYLCGGYILIEASDIVSVTPLEAGDGGISEEGEQPWHTTTST